MDSGELQASPLQVFSSSSLSSESWHPGSDGRMHQQVHSEHHQSDGNREVKSTRICKDGNCQELVQRQKSSPSRAIGSIGQLMGGGDVGDLASTLMRERGPNLVE